MRGLCLSIVRAGSVGTLDTYMYILDSWGHSGARLPCSDTVTPLITLVAMAIGPVCGRTMHTVSLRKYPTARDYHVTRFPAAVGRAIFRYDGPVASR